MAGLNFCEMELSKECVFCKNLSKSLNGQEMKHDHQEMKHDHQEIAAMMSMSVNTELSCH